MTLASLIPLSVSTWIQTLQPASYNGVPFAVEVAEGEAGRRQALHQYPKRDTPWAEDMGRKPRGSQLNGFLIGDDIPGLLEQMLEAVETPGPGQLVHPTLGLQMVAVTGFRHRISKDRGRIIELQFTFVEAGQRLFPTTVTATQPAVLSSATAADVAASEDFQSVAATALVQGAQVAAQALNTSSSFIDLTQSLGTDATNLTNMVSSLLGPYGRYFNGGNTGAFATNNNPVVSSTETIESLTLEGVQNQQEINTASEALTTAAKTLTTTTTSEYAAAIQALGAALLEAIVNPADGIRLLASLAGFAPNATLPNSQLGVAMASMQTAVGNLCCRTAVIALARAAQNYQPTSYNDATNVRDQVVTLLDCQITIAGDSGEDASYNALSDLRVSVIQDLTARGANLATVATFTFGASLPSLVLAQRLYRDASRADELVTESNPIAPLFMPISFRALSS